MGSAQSRDDLGNDTGFLPQYHLLKLLDGDMQRLFVPINFVDRCSLRAGDEVALVDCLGRTVSAMLESVAALHYLGGGWEFFLKMVGAVKGDSVLFEFSSVRTCKIVLFGGVFGVQKFPLLEDEFRQRVLYPRQPHCFYGRGWPEPDSPTRALAAGPCTLASTSWSAATPFDGSYISVCDGAVCNATGKSVDRIMMHFLLELARTSTLQMPLYYCKLGIVELEAGFISLDKGFSRSHISELMDGSYSKPITIRRSTDCPVPARLFLDFQGGCHISDGWLNFVRQQGALEMTECVLQFSKSEDKITVEARMLCSVQCC